MGIDEGKSGQIAGLIAAVHTPMSEDGNLNLSVVEKQYNNLRNNKVIGAFLSGTTGEGMSLSTDERLRLAERWGEVIDSDFLLFIHVGHNSIVESKLLAKHAEKKVKANAISLMGPNIFKPGTVQDLAIYCAEIACSAPDTPFYYYHMPEISGVHFPMIEFVKIASKIIPTFSGLKYTYHDLMDYGQCLEFDNGKYNILFGRDEMLLSALALGAKGAIGSTYNLAAPLYHKIIDSLNQGNLLEAQKHQKKAREFIGVLRKYRDPVSIKAAMRLIGIDCGPSRLPLKNLTPEEFKNFQADLDRIGFFEFCSQIIRTPDYSN